MVCTLLPRPFLAWHSDLKNGAERGEGSRSYSTIVHQFGSAIAASSAGWSRDTLLSYVPAFIAAGIFSGLAVLLIILFKFLDMRAGGLRPQG